jgi:hypothetical protein
VDAFGIEAFPYYQSEPPVLAVWDEEQVTNRQQQITGVDDAIQAGLRIILWCAATVKPAFVLPAHSEWYLQVNLRNSVKTWAYHCVIGNGMDATVDPEILSCVGKAFEELAKPCSLLTHEEAAYCQQSKILEELPTDRFKSPAHFKKFLDQHPEIKTFNRGQKLFVHVGYLFKVLADIRRDTKRAVAEAVDDILQNREEAEQRKRQGRS